ncbi:nonstructural protein 2 [Galliform chaphamaparvovirus 15]|nr:nonstructural protein 2 [Galliform chaphamaparvovirus 15]
MICHLVAFILELLNQAANAVTASSVGAGRLLLASQQLAECRQRADPRAPMNSWMPGLHSQNLLWAPDPCQKEQDAVDQLQQQAAAGGNQVATQQLGGAPAPQLAEATDPVPNPDPAVPENEFAVPYPHTQNQWSPILPEDVVDMIVDHYRENDYGPPDQDMLDEILEMMKIYHLWCPWGGPGVKNLKWRMKYQPPAHDWIGKWVP